MSVTGKHFALGLRLITQVIMLATIPTSFALAQAGSSGTIYEKVFVKATSRPEVFKDDFAVSNFESDYFLSVTTLDKRSGAVSILVNGKVVSNILNPSIFQRHLLKLNVLANNSIEIKMTGAKASSVLVKVFQFSSFEPIFGPESFIKDQKPIFREFNVVDTKSQHLLVVEADSSAIKDKNLAIIKLNNKIIVNPSDFTFDKRNRFIKSITVQEKNKLEISLIGKGNSGIRVSILAPEEEEVPSPGKLSLVNLSPKVFNPVGADVLIKLDGAVFPASQPAVTIIYNNEVLEDEKFSVTSNQILIPGVLIPGENKMEVIAFDSDGGSLSINETLWAGSANVTIVVYGSEGSVPNAEVSATLSDDKNVTVQGKTDANGRLVLNNIPPRTIFYTAKSGLRIQTYAEVSSTDYFVVLDLKDLMEPGEATNLDFSQGLEGWELSNPEAVELIPHVEDNIDEPATSAQAASLTMQYSPADISKMTFAQRKAYRKSQVLAKAKNLATAKVSASIDNQLPDMSISTSGSINPVSAGRTIKIGSGVSLIKIRYKFVTNEIPGGYFGSEFNDRFSVSISTNLVNYPTRMVINSMNGLGREAFSDQGATVWREMNLPIAPGVAYVNIVAEVQNVGDEQYDSTLIIDSIDENAFAIAGGELFDMDGALLQNLSVAWENPYLFGNTVINGSLLLVGDVDDKLTGLYVGVVQNGRQVGYANITPEKEYLLTRFDTEAMLFLPQKLYSLPNINTHGVALDKNGTLELVVRAFNSTKQVSSFTIERPIKLLTRSRVLTDAQRFGATRDYEMGGDDWGTPACVATADALIASFSAMNFKVNDYSNMNGGSFAPHALHNEGRDVDFWITGLKRGRMPDAFDAQRTLEIIRSNENILYIGVAYDVKSGDPFYDAIKNEKINGLPATRFFRSWNAHQDHFHIRCRD